GFAFLDRELNYIRVNDRLAEMNGIPAEAHIGRHLSEIVPMLVKDLQEVVDRILKTGRPICNHRVFGETAAAPGLKRYWSESWYPMFDQGGEIIGFGAVVEDITDGVLAERSILENEQRMRMATEATGVGIWEWDLITDKIRWDKQMFRIYGIAPTPDRTVDYSTWKLAVLPEDLPLQEKVLQDTISRTGRSTREFRILRAKDKQCRYIQGTETVRVNAQGQAEWMVGTNLDITERKQAEQALKEADRRKDEFLAMLAHELRNPLGPIRNVAQLLKMDGLDEKRISWCGDVVDRQVKHLSQLVDDLLDISRITLGKIELKKEPLAVADYVLPAVETTRPIIEARQQVLSMTLPPQPLRVEGDRVRLTQVVTNLLSNAAKYTGQGGHIGLTVEQQEDKMCIRVSDTGCGIDASELPRLFDLFYQVDGDIARSQGGLGIGLSLVYRLVMMHGGDIQAFSAGKGQGSEFVVRLPLLSSPDTVKSAVQTYPPSMNRGLDILIVDDSCAAAESLAMLLELQGHRVWMAHDGISAVETALVKHPQVIILDIGLPVMDGYAVARKLRQSPELGEMLIIALSGYAPPNDPEVLRATGFDEYLVKPVDMEKLQRLFRKSQELV
ncbi:MAG: ATP-binding protein, partial [Methylobacter sp.]